jgi:hypothetical protein
MYGDPQSMWACVNFSYLSIFYLCGFLIYVSFSSGSIFRLFGIFMHAMYAGGGLFHEIVIVQSKSLVFFFWQLQN